MSNKRPLPDPLQKKPGLLVGAWRERVILRLNQRRSAWAHPLQPEPDVVATPAALDELLRLVLDLARFVPGLEIGCDAESASGENSVMVGGDFLIHRRYDSTMGVYLWAGVDFCPGDRKMARRFSGTRGMLEFVIGRVLADAPCELHENAKAALVGFADGPLGVDAEFLCACVEQSSPQQVEVDSQDSSGGLF